MSVFAANASQNRCVAPAFSDRNFMAEYRYVFLVCVVSWLARETAWRNRFPGCCVVGIGKQSVQKIPRTMRSILAALLLCSAFSAAGTQGLIPQTPAPEAPASSDAVARGKALTEAADCAGCHTAAAAQHFAGGKRLNSQFGAIYSPNLTPDRDTGIGGWSEDDFYRALHEGIAPDGSHYYPVFSYPNFTRMTRDDVLAIHTYLATLKPVHNTPPPPQLQWPYKYRVLMR